MNRPSADRPGSGSGENNFELVPEPERPWSEQEESTGQRTREQLREVKDRVVDRAKSTLDQTREQASSTLSEGRRRAADQVTGVASAIHRTSQHLREEDQARFARLADSFGSQVDEVANYLRDTDARAMARDLERLARRQPAVVLGAAFAIGLAGARFFKSSERESDRYGGYDRIGPGAEPAGIGRGGIDDQL
jgi:hypothetical protein